MQQRILPAAALAISLFVFGYSCNKLDTTRLGSDLVTVDNVNTFLDTYDLKTSQGIFLAGTDSTVVLKNSNHVLGNIGFDPQFGATQAAVYVQFKPTFYPFYFGNAGDTVKGLTPATVVGLDSIVLCLSYKGVWGDSSAATSIPQTFVVNAISNVAINARFKDNPDTLWGLGYRPSVSSFLGSATYTPQKTRNYSKFGKPSNRDSINNQIRIKLDTSIIGYMFREDSAVSAVSSNGFLNDSLFRQRFRGFEIKSTSTNGNTLYYVNLAEANSRLEFHYRKRKSNVLDTVMQAFQVYPSSNTVFGVRASSTTNYLKRDYTGAPVQSPAVNDLYIQAAPGTFVNVQIPDLDTLRNRNDKIIHRAYLIIEQNDNIISSQTYTAPPFLYMDIKDSVTAVAPNPQKYKPLYFDLTQRFFYAPDEDGSNQFYHPYPQGNVDINNFGGIALQRADAVGSYIRYEFNITRYVQHIVSNNFKNYDLRIFAPFNYFYPQYQTKYVIPFYNQLAAGRVRVGAGAKGTGNTFRKMRMEIIYSKVK